MAPSFLLYGSYVYTGQLIAGEALRFGLRPVLAVRNAQRLASQAERLGLDYRVFNLDNLKLLAERAEAWLEAPEAYTLTALAAVHIAHQALSGCAKPGYQTSDGAYGPELALKLPGVRLR